MSDRVFATLFYIAFIVGSSWIAVSAGVALTREALTNLAVFPAGDPRPSRVDTYLAAQDRAPEVASVEKPLVPEASPLALGALAKAMDDAEHPNASVVDAAENELAAPQLAEKPRVAGWAKRMPKRQVVAAPEETANRIIMRSLRADM